MLLGRVLDQGSQDCIFFAQNRLVATIGLERIIVVDTPDATLVCHRDRAQEVKDLVAELHRQRWWSRCSTPRWSVPGAAIRSWTRGRVLRSNGSWWTRGKSSVSRCTSTGRNTGWWSRAPPGSPSARRSGWWRSNQSVYIPQKTPHRLENPTVEPIQLIEVQTGAYLEEDDIQRLEDDYWRGPK